MKRHYNIFYVTFIVFILTLVIVKEERVERYIIVQKLIKGCRRREQQNYSLCLPYMKTNANSQRTHMHSTLPLLSISFFSYRLGAESPNALHWPTLTYWRSISQSTRANLVRKLCFLYTFYEP